MHKSFATEIAEGGKSRNMRSFSVLSVYSVAKYRCLAVDFIAVFG